MKINRLRLYGWIGIAKGLGLEELDLDLSGLSGLIALSGKNGAGKSTVIESLQPYRCLASRKRALPAHVVKRDSVKELDFDFQGDNYKTKVLIDCDSGRQEGYIWKNGESVVDGKARNYDSYIEDLFGSKDLFFNSIFCAQNASKLSDLTTGKLKELFAEFLRLNQYIAYEATTKQCITLLSSQGSAYTSQATSIRDRLNSHGDLEASLRKAQEDLDQANQLHSQTMQYLVELDANIAKAKEALAANKTFEDRKAEYENRQIRLQKEKEVAHRDYENEAEGLRKKVKEYMAAIVEMAKLLDDTDRILAAIERRKELAEEIEIKSKAVDTAYAQREVVQGKIKKIEGRIQTEIQPHPDEQKIPILENQISMLKNQTKDLERRDPECTSTVCGFIVTALEAQKKIPDLESQLTAMKEEVRKHGENNHFLSMKLNKEKRLLEEENEGITRSVNQIQRRLIEIKNEHSELTILAGKEGALREAIARKEAAEKAKDETTDQGMKLKAGFDERVKAIDAEITEIQTKVTELSCQMDTGAKDRLEDLEKRRKESEETLKGKEARIAECMADIRTIQDRIAEKATLEKQLQEIEAKGLQIQGQVSEWVYLRNAVSKNGYPALEIESVAPSISAYTNQILFNTFGPAYSVKIRTQDDEGREVLDILALEEDGREAFLDDLSGGQQVWCLKAIRWALTLLAKQKSGKAFDSAMADEEDGALDAENAQNFIGLYRAFMEAGDFKTCYFITHRPECVAMADHVLIFGEGGISVN